MKGKCQPGILRDADIVIAEKRGYFVHYRANEETLAKWQKTANHLLDPNPAKHVLEIACENMQDGITKRLSGTFPEFLFPSPKRK